MLLRVSAELVFEGTFGVARVKLTQRFGRDFEHYLVQPSCYGQGHLLLYPGTQSPIPPDPEHVK